MEQNANISAQRVGRIAPSMSLSVNSISSFPVSRQATPFIALFSPALRMQHLPKLISLTDEIESPLSRNAVA